MAYAGNILRVNLSTGQAASEELDGKKAYDYIGGRGLAAKILYDEIDPKTDPLGADNKILFATGPLTGTPVPAASRYMVVTKSPLTGAIACSNSGGFFPAELKYAGYDIVLVEGKAAEPVYIWIKNGEVEIRPAKDIWGKTTHEAEDIIIAETDPDAKVCSIGPAGETMVRIACVINDKHRSAGRSGVGAVMGSKNLKAIAVRGTVGLKPADSEAFRAECLRLVKHASNHPAVLALRANGTTNGVNIANKFGVFPTRNYKSGVFEKYQEIGPEKLHRTVFVRARACAGCPVACKRVTRLDTDKYQGAGEGPEYETLYSFGGMTGVDDIYAVTKANYICNELGMDTISAGATIACAMEMFEEGYISEEQVGRSLTFGDPEAMVEMLEKMGRREGFGDLMAEGSFRMAEEFGVSHLSISVKGQELAGWGTRGFKGMGLNYATGNRGACHTKGNTMGAELFGKMDALATEGKPQLIAGAQDAAAALDSTGLCLFINGVIKPKDVISLLKTGTGNEYDEESYARAGSRIWNIERMFNMGAGFTADDDTLPKRLLEEPMPEGPGQGQVVELDAMLPEYYQQRGWDAKGKPTKEKLKELGIS